MGFTYTPFLKKEFITFLVILPSLLSESIFTYSIVWLWRVSALYIVTIADVVTPIMQTCSPIELNRQLQ